ncbi:MAG: hypothetical protein Ct9H90mP1_3050 [Methanobacteriota archaeon]|nr:MAG: hypothetical protein Ct9H90mP1_3050 [Euryarchaeota archaeon]
MTVTSYINLDMAGVNWPGGEGPPRDPDPQIDEDGYPKDSEVWPLRVYIGPGPNHDRLDQPGMVGLSNWIGPTRWVWRSRWGPLWVRIPPRKPGKPMFG